MEVHLDGVGAPVLAWAAHVFTALHFNSVFNYHFIKCEKTAVLNCSAAVIYSLDSTFLESSSDIQSCQ